MKVTWNVQALSFCPIPTVLSALLTVKRKERMYGWARKKRGNWHFNVLRHQVDSLRMEGSQGVVVTWWCHCPISRFWILTKFRTKSISDWTSSFLSRPETDPGKWWLVLGADGVHTHVYHKTHYFFIFLDPGRSDGWLEECYMQAFARRSILAFFLSCLTWLFMRCLMGGFPIHTLKLTFNYRSIIKIHNNCTYLKSTVCWVLTYVCTHETIIPFKIVSICISPQQCFTSLCPPH